MNCSPSIGYCIYSLCMVQFVLLFDNNMNLKKEISK